MGADTVFISYSHDSPEHSARVLALSDKLREMGVDVELDQYHVRPPQGWPRWCEEQLRPENAKFVTVICTHTYRDRVENKVAADEGRGVFWEGGVIYQYLYDQKENTRFIPVLLGDAPEDGIPLPLKGHARYRVKAFDLSDPGFEGLYRELTGQPAVIKRGLGEKVILAPRGTAAPSVAAPLPPRPVQTSFPAPAAAPTDISRVDRYAPKELIGRGGGDEGHRRRLGEGRNAGAAAPARPHLRRPRRRGEDLAGGEVGGRSWRIRTGRGARPPSRGPSTARARATSIAASSDLFLTEALTFFGDAAMARARRARSTKAGGWPSSSASGGRCSSSTAWSRCNTRPPRPRRASSRTRARRPAQRAGRHQPRPVRRHHPVFHPRPARLLADHRAGREARAPVQGSRRGAAQETRREGNATGVRDAGGRREGPRAHLEPARHLPARRHAGDIRKRDLVKLEEADAEEQGGHAFRVMDAYVRVVRERGRERPARAGAAAAARVVRPARDRRLPGGVAEELQPIPGLTEALVGISEAQRNVAFTRLETRSCSR